LRESGWAFAGRPLVALGWMETVLLQLFPVSGAKYKLCHGETATSGSGGVVAGIQDTMHQANPSLSSADTDRSRTSQLRHAVQDMDGDTNFCASTFVVEEPQRIANDSFISTNRSLNTASLSVARGLLPCDPAF
jgi:hypothetical protein